MLEGGLQGLCYGFGVNRFIEKNITPSKESFSRRHLNQAFPNSFPNYEEHHHNRSIWPSRAIRRAIRRAIF